MNFRERLRLKLPMDRYVAVELLVGGIYSFAWIVLSVLSNKHEDIAVLLGSVLLLVHIGFEIVEFLHRLLFSHITLLILKFLLLVFILAVFLSTFFNWQLIVPYEFIDRIRIMLLLFLLLGFVSISLQLKGDLKKRALE